MKAKDVRILYYYLRDQLNRPLVTVCLGLKDGEHARGISVCSNRDVLKKKEGRDYARAYMMQALGSKKTGALVTEDRCLEVLDTVAPLQIVNNVHRALTVGMPKSHYMPMLTAYERKIVGESSSGVE